MAFTNRHKALTYELFGIPRTGEGGGVSGGLHRPPTMSLAYATYRQSDHSNITTLLDAAILAVENLSDSGTENRIKVHLEAYDEIADSVTVVSKSASGEGLLADDEAKISKLRDLVANNLGFSVPRGTWADDAKAAYGKDATGLGDR